MASLTTNAYLSDQVATTNNHFSAGIWDENNEIKICHSIGQEDSYHSILLTSDGILEGHTGLNHHNGRDIVPPFDYSEPIQHFAGQNWDEVGQAIYNNGCE